MADELELKNIDDILIYEQNIDKYFKPDKNLSFFIAKKEKVEYVYNSIWIAKFP